MRIIAGEFKGKKLAEFDFDNIRPTSDNVKEAIFNKLQFDIAGCSFLDLFGGTGAVALEAYSRGANNVVVCDNNINSISVINKNINSIKANDIKVMRMDYIKAMQQLSASGGKFDIIFIDPPYKTEYGEIALNKVVDYKLLNEDGIIVFEHSRNKKYDYSDNLKLIDTKIYGKKVVSYFVNNNND